MNPGMAAGVGGWSSPGRMTSPKVSVTKKKNETKLIKEFKSNRYPDLELRDLCGHVIEFAQDQQGEGIPTDSMRTAIHRKRNGGDKLRSKRRKLAC